MPQTPKQDEMRRLIETRTPGLLRTLYDIAEDEEAPPSSRLSAIKEILDRTLGKGSVLAADDGADSPREIVFRLEK